MSVRQGLWKAWSVGRYIFRAWKSQFRVIPSSCPKSNIFSEQVRVQATSSVQQRYESARRIFANNVLRRVTNPISADLRKKTTRQLLFGNSGPFFAFVGIGLASGSIITKEDELEGLCWEIREAVSRMQTSMAEAESDIFFPNEEIKLNKFSIGNMISKGSNGAVYLAKKIPPSEITNDEDHQSVENESPKLSPNEPSVSFPYAMKVVFNYDIESRASSILRSMYCETIPARIHFVNWDTESSWNQLIKEKTITIPPHPNIVAMHCAFADRVYELPDVMETCAATLPRRINPDGFGRNMSLYLLMKRYDTTLAEYLKDFKPDTREAIVLFAQLLESIAHINGCGVAHRDIKSNNVLLELDTNEFGSYADKKSKPYPRLALTDFGCCLADSTFGLMQPYITGDISKGGNPALMAPEIALARPGLISILDYSKSDAWAAATLAYELFLGYNPFYRDLEKNPKPLQSSTYAEDDLPKLSDDVPHLIRRVVETLLIRNPRKRISASFAADVLQLYLWAPNSWMKRNDSEPLPRSSEIMQWLLCLTTKVLTTASFEGRRSQAEYLLIGSFLRRTKISSIRSALAWSQQQ